jgi:hypothetical protein
MVLSAHLLWPCALRIADHEPGARRPGGALGRFHARLLWLPGAAPGTEDRSTDGGRTVPVAIPVVPGHGVSLLATRHRSTSASAVSARAIRRSSRIIFFRGGARNALGSFRIRGAGCWPSCHRQRPARRAGLCRAARCNELEEAGTAAASLREARCGRSQSAATTRSLERADVHLQSHPPSSSRALATPGTPRAGSPKSRAGRRMSCSSVWIRRLSQPWPR